MGARSTEMESNFALYRQQFKKINPNMDEKEIYANWHNLTYGGWNVQTSPAKGYDGLYHYIYISVRYDGKFYIGKHSTADLADGYHGSGTEIGESIDKGHTFKTTVLEYFRNSNAAYDAENKVVNNRLLNESDGMVLNHSVGGRNYVPPTIQESPVEVYKPKKPRYCTFTMLGCKVGDKITFIDDDNIVCKVNDDRTVIYQGRVYSLFALAKKVSKINFRNALDVWKFKGKVLAKIRDEMDG